MRVFVVFLMLCGIAAAAVGIDVMLWGLPSQHAITTAATPAVAHPSAPQEQPATPPPASEPAKVVDSTIQDMEAWWTFRQEAMRRMDAWWNSRPRAERQPARPTKSKPAAADTTAAEKSWGSPDGNTAPASYDSPRYLTDTSRWPLHGPADSKP